MRELADDFRVLQITTIGAATMIVVLYPKFRTPEWRPVRAFMFVAMGLSAVVPVLHGLQMFGYEQMEKQIGLSWLVGQGVLYIAGAAIYAASWPSPFVCRGRGLTADRLEYQNGSGLVPSTSGATRIRYSMFSSSWRRRRIWLACSKLSIMSIRRGVS